MGCWWITRVTINKTTWTPVLAPDDCDHIVISNDDGRATVIRSDQNNASTEKTIPAGMSQTVTGPHSRMYERARFCAGEVVCYAMAAAGFMAPETNTLVIDWWR